MSGTTVRKSVAGPNGIAVTAEDLPEADVCWTPRRKATVVALVRGGLVSLAFVLKKYSMTTEEYAGWEASLNRDGLEGLRITHTQRYRRQ